MDIKFIRILIASCIVLLGFVLFLSFAGRLETSKDDARKDFSETEFSKEVFPKGVRLEPFFKKKVLLCYQVWDHEKKLLGYIFKVKKFGYTSDIVTVAAMTPDGVIARIKILSQRETYGIGSRVVEDEKAPGGFLGRFWFQDQFRGKKVSELSSNVEAVTGATITSRAVIDSIAERAQEILLEAK